MKTTYVVERHRFPTFVLACDYARHKAAQLGRDVEVEAEVSKSVTRVQRKWVASMHPPLTASADKNSPLRNFVAAAEQIA